MIIIYFIELSLRQIFNTGFVKHSVFTVPRLYCWRKEHFVSSEWLYFLTHRSRLIRFFSLLTGISILILADGLLLVRLARIRGVYFALALEGLVTIAAAIVLGSTINNLIRKIRSDAQRGSCIPRRYAHLAAVVTAGVLLFIPGFITDLVGLAIYLPPGRFFFTAFFQRRNISSVAKAYEYLTLEISSSPFDANADDE